MSDITTEEAVWLIKSTFNMSHALGKPIVLDDITPEHVEKKLKEYRAINDGYESLVERVTKAEW